MLQRNFIIGKNINYGGKDIVVSLWCLKVEQTIVALTQRSICKKDSSELNLSLLKTGEEEEFIML
ncbi:MAG: hypothetical protein A2Y40_02540 [Candidatus Margulisbacteria bacterium GWF2_35_9]|nr:MAG: hypothetical protein A2Y40_02540 [Candidatus Margulisbacteria bacterium GWF2_35_9]